MMFVKIEGVLIKKKVPVVLESNLSKKKAAVPRLDRLDKYVKGRKKNLL